MTNRITDPHELMFPVRTVGVYAELREGVNASRQRIPGKKAIVNCTNDQVLSVVSNGYQVVTNRDALDYGIRCCEAAFPDIPRSAWDVSSADAPISGGHCHFDLTHNSALLRFDSVSAGQRPDTYGPFVRVANSYNRKRALGFTIGFMRKVCSNGMIVPESSISFSLNHNTNRIRERIEFETSRTRFTSMKTKFLEFLAPLQECLIPAQFFLPISLFALRVPIPEKPSEREQEAWRHFRSHINSLSEGYIDQVGGNAYALLNVISDLASRPSETVLRRRERHSLQRLAGTWLAEFSAECKQRSFDLRGYVERLPCAEPGRWEPKNQGRLPSGNGPRSPELGKPPSRRRELARQRSLGTEFGPGSAIGQDWS